MASRTSTASQNAQRLTTRRITRFCCKAIRESASNRALGCVQCEMNTPAESADASSRAQHEAANSGSLPCAGRSNIDDCYSSLLLRYASFLSFGVAWQRYLSDGARLAILALVATEKSPAPYFRFVPCTHLDRNRDDNAVGLA